MARCTRCGNPVHGEYCDACGAEVLPQAERNLPPAPAAARQQRTGAPVRPAPRRWGATALAAALVFLAGGATGYAVGRWQAGSAAPAAAADAYQPPAVLADMALNEGTRLLGAGERDAALAQFRKADRYFAQAREQEPDNLYVQTYAGLTAFYLGEADRAFALHQQVLEQDPNYLWAIFNLAWMHQATGDLQGAAELYRRYLEAAPAEQANSFKYMEQPGLIEQQVTAAAAALQSLGVPVPAQP